MILDSIELYLPAGWTLSNLIAFDAGWQANIKDTEHVAVGTGESIEEALLDAREKALAHNYTGRLYLSPTEGERESFVLRPALGDLLGLAKAPANFKRRV